MNGPVDQERYVLPVVEIWFGFELLPRMGIQKQALQQTVEFLDVGLLQNEPFAMTGPALEEQPVSKIFQMISDVRTLDNKDLHQSLSVSAAKVFVPLIELIADADFEMAFGNAIENIEK